MKGLCHIILLIFHAIIGGLGNFCVSQTKPGLSNTGDIIQKLLLLRWVFMLVSVHKWQRKDGDIIQKDTLIKSGIPLIPFVNKWCLIKYG